MLVITRRVGEWIQIGDDVRIQVVRNTHGSVRVGIEAPRDVKVLRGEVLERDQRDSEAA